MTHQKPWGPSAYESQETAKLRHSHPVTIDPAPMSYLRGYVADRLEDLHTSRGKWIPHLLHRIDPLAKDVWGKWNPEVVAGAEKGRAYGFEPVKAFWFQGEKAGPDARKFSRMISAILFWPTLI